MREERSVGVGARRTIFLARMVLRGREGFGKGGFSRPVLGVIINF